jgi:glycosyltransferase involved in cell wall biosynthesis
VGGDRDRTGGALAASVLLATRNRAGLLRATLAHLARQVTDGLRWEVVVVDNGSEDGTAAVLAEARATLPLVVVSEPRAGKNRALNRALPLARGALLVFTDDDVEPEPRWLAEHVGAARRWPSHAVFGGPIAPRMPPTAPPWLATYTFSWAARRSC